MYNYLISFKTESGSKQQVWVSAMDETQAKQIFEQQYCFDSIISIIETTD